MSLSTFRQILPTLKPAKNDLTYFPRWIEAYAQHPTVAQQTPPDGNLPVESTKVIAFLQQLRDHGIPAWRRLQAARALELYQFHVRKACTVDFAPIRRKLTEIAAREKRLPPAPHCTARDPAPCVPGEGNPGRLDPNEPVALQQMRAKLRLLHHPKSTEEAYVGNVKKFIRHLDDDQLEVDEVETGTGPVIDEVGVIR